MNNKGTPITQETPGVLGALCQEWQQRPNLFLLMTQYPKAILGAPHQCIFHGTVFLSVPTVPQDVFESKAPTAGLRWKQHEAAGSPEEEVATAGCCCLLSCMRQKTQLRLQTGLGKKQDLGGPCNRGPESLRQFLSGPQLCSTRCTLVEGPACTQEVFNTCSLCSQVAHQLQASQPHATASRFGERMLLVLRSSSQTVAGILLERRSHVFRPEPITGRWGGVC